jgi:tight adherence protein C
MNAFLRELAGIDLAFVLMALLVFGAIAAAVTSVRYLLASRVDMVEARVRRYIAGRRSSYPPPPSLVEVRGGRATLLDTALKPFAVVATPGSDEEIGRLRARLSHAGYRGDRAIFVFLGIKVVLSLMAGALLLWLNAVRPQPLQYAAFYTVFAMAAGYYLPSLWLSARVESRQTRINRAIPDTLDLMVTCVDSGLGLDAAMNRVAEEIALSAPLLSAELMQAALEVRAGSTRSEAFRRLAERTGVEELQHLSAIIVQTEVFGTSMAKALRITAEGMRVRRMQRAEERAAKVAVKMTIPLVVCILPSLFTVLLGPAVISIIRILMPRMGGG